MKRFLLLIILVLAFSVCALGHKVTTDITGASTCVVGKIYRLRRRNVVQTNERLTPIASATCLPDIPSMVKL